MTDAQAQTVLQYVEEYFGSPEGQGFDIGNPKHFEEVVAYVRPHVHGVTEGDLRVVTAMCVLGPGSVSGMKPPGRFHGAESVPPQAIAVHLRVFWPAGPVMANPELPVIPESRDGASGLLAARRALSGQLWV